MNKYELPNKSKHVYRWAGQHLIGKRSSIAEHSYEVSMYVLFIVKELQPFLSSYNEFSRLRSEALECALLHDIPEVFTGDVPLPVKREFPLLKDMLKGIEKSFMLEILPEFYVDYTEECLLVVKAADTMAVFKEISEELLYNNRVNIEDGAETVSEVLSDLFSKFSHLEPKLLKALHDVLQREGLPVGLIKIGNE